MFDLVLAAWRLIAVRRSAEKLEKFAARVDDYDLYQFAHSTRLVATSRLRAIDNEIEQRLQKDL